MTSQVFKMASGAGLLVESTTSSAKLQQEQWAAAAGETTQRQCACSKSQKPSLVMCDSERKASAAWQAVRVAAKTVQRQCACSTLRSLPASPLYPIPVFMYQLCAAECYTLCYNNQVQLH